MYARILITTIIKYMTSFQKCNN